MQTTYSVPGISCGNSRTAITGEVAKIAGVSAVDVDLHTKTVTVTGAGFNDAAVRDAIESGLRRRLGTNDHHDPHRTNRAV